MAQSKETKANLIEAAVREFDEFGFDGTNSNRIARRAGYAPQTFYRHFADKMALFVAIYEQWNRDNISLFASAPNRHAAALSVVASHRKTLRFRRSLRQLTNSETRVAEARAASRKIQIEGIARALPGLMQPEIVALLFTIERIADAIVEGEFALLGVEEGEAVEQLATCLKWVSSE